MKVLITAGAGRLAQAVAAAWRSEHEFFMFDSAAEPPDSEGAFIKGSLFDLGDVRDATEGIEAVIHLNQPPQPLPDDVNAREELTLDLATRGTDVLFRTAVRAGAKRFVFISTLDLFEAHGEDYIIDEGWRPLPSTHASQLAPYLGEIIAREFACDHMISVACLRLGRIMGEAPTDDEQARLPWIVEHDAAQAIGLALNIDWSDRIHAANRFGVIHITSGSVDSPFQIRSAVKGLNYEPSHGQQDWD